MPSIVESIESTLTLANINEAMIKARKEEIKQKIARVFQVPAIYGASAVKIIKIETIQISSSQSRRLQSSGVRIIFQILAFDSSSAATW